MTSCLSFTLRILKESKAAVENIFQKRKSLDTKIYGLKIFIFCEDSEQKLGSSPAAGWYATFSVISAMLGRAMTVTIVMGATGNR